MFAPEPLKDFDLGALDRALARFDAVRRPLEVRNPGIVGLYRLLVLCRSNVPPGYDLSNQCDQPAQQHDRDEPPRRKDSEGEGSYACRTQRERGDLDNLWSRANHRSQRTVRSRRSPFELCGVDDAHRRRHSHAFALA